MDNERRPWWALGCSGDLTARDLANLRNLNLWVLATTLLFAVALMALTREAATPAWIPVLVPPILACWMLLRAGTRFVREADELTRRIQIEAMAVGFAVGFVMILIERLVTEAVELVPDPGWLSEVPDLLMPFVWMLLAYSFATIRLQRKYS